MSLADNIASYLEQNQPRIKLAILFGSVSRGEQRFESDMDIAVAGDNILSVTEKQELIESLASISSRAIDLIDLKLYQEPLLSKILTTGKLIYCTDRRLYAELIKRMLFDQADFMPLRTAALKRRRQAWIKS